MVNDDDNSRGKEDGKILPFRKEKSGKSKTNGEANGKGNERQPRLTPDRKFDFEHNHQDREIFAERVAVRFDAYRNRIREMGPEIDTVIKLFHDHVEHSRGTVTICGCHSFTEYCETKFHCSRQNVYAIVHDYKKKAKTKKRPGGKRDREEFIPKEVAMRMQEGLYKANEARAAKTEEEREKAWREFDEIKDFKPLESLMGAKIDRDQPDYERLVRDLLVAGIYMHNALKNIANSGMLDDGSALLMMLRAALEKGQIFDAVAKRLNVMPTVN